MGACVRLEVFEFEVGDGHFGCLCFRCFDVVFYLKHDDDERAVNDIRCERVQYSREEKLQPKLDNSRNTTATMKADLLPSSLMPDVTNEHERAEEQSQTKPCCDSFIALDYSHLP